MYQFYNVCFANSTLIVVRFNVGKQIQAYLARNATTMKCTAIGLSTVFNILAPLQSVMLLLLLISWIYHSDAFSHIETYFSFRTCYFLLLSVQQTLRDLPCGRLAPVETVPELCCSRTTTHTGGFTLIKRRLLCQHSCRLV